jgi:hypothetical protein
MGTPDSPVLTGHDTVQCLVPATSVARWSRPLDSFALVVHQTIQCDLIVADCFLTSDISDLWQSIVGENDRWSWTHRTV